MSEKVRVVPAPVFEGSGPSVGVSPHWAKYGGPSETIARITDKTGVVEAPLDGDGNRLLARNEFLKGIPTSNYRPYLEARLRALGPFDGPQSAADMQALINEAQKDADADYLRSWKGAPYGVAPLDREFVDRQHANPSEKGSAALFRVVVERGPRAKG
jgi:hypothetical protein